jgi:HlyD family secretion protein
MSGEEDRSPFRQESLERLSSPERLDQLLALVDRKSWIPLAASGVIVVTLLGWAFFGTVPIHVEGRGILLRPRKVVTFESPGDGRLAQLLARVGDDVAAGQVLAVLSRPDLEKQLDAERTKALELTARSQAAQLLRIERGAIERQSSRSQSKSLRHHIDESRELAESLREKARSALELERRDIERQIAVARSLSEGFGERLRGHRALVDEGLVSPDALADSEERYVDSLSRLTRLEADLRGLATRELEAEEGYLERLRRIGDLDFELSGLDAAEKRREQEDLESAGAHEFELAEVRGEIARLEAMIEDQGRIVAKEAGRVLEIGASVGEFLEAGDRVGAMAVADPVSPLESVVYFTVRDGKRIVAGKEIQVTPDTFERRREGAIRGTIRSVSEYPVTIAEARTVIGNEAVAETLIASGYLIQVEAELEREPANPSGYVWTTSRGPEMPISAGTTATARVAVESRAPVSFVLPGLKSAVGID